MNAATVNKVIYQNNSWDELWNQLTDPELISRLNSILEAGRSGGHRTFKDAVEAQRPNKAKRSRTRDSARVDVFDVICKEKGRLLISGIYIC